MIIEIKNYYKKRKNEVVTDNTLSINTNQELIKTRHMFNKEDYLFESAQLKRPTDYETPETSQKFKQRKSHQEHYQTEISQNNSLCRLN